MRRTYKTGFDNQTITCPPDLPENNILAQTGTSLPGPCKLQGVGQTDTGVETWRTRRQV